MRFLRHSQFGFRLLRRGVVIHFEIFSALVNNFGYSNRDSGKTSGMIRRCFFGAVARQLNRFEQEHGAEAERITALERQETPPAQEVLARDRLKLQAMSHIIKSGWAARDAKSKEMSSDRDILRALSTKS